MSGAGRARCGDHDSTYALPERAIATRDGDVLWVMTAIPYVYSLHSEARYQLLLRRIGLPAAPGR